MKLLGLLGYPLSHSFSPRMINKIARENNWDCSYHPFSVPGSKMADFINAVKLLPIAGFNVTIPHKQSILTYCDELSDDVREIGAANTIINDGGGLIAWNTDVVGFKYGMKSLLPENSNLSGALILGAGGVARAVVYALKKMGCRTFYLTDVNPEREQQWRNEVSSMFNECEIHFFTPQMERLREIVRRVHLIIQATPVGTFPNIDETVRFPFENLTQNHYVYDLVYNPLETKFVRLAKQSGAQAHNGLNMLAAQAAKSLEHWGFSVATEVLYDILLAEIQN